MAKTFSLEGRRALITGASGALGGHFARVLHEAGASVVLAARRRDKIVALAETLGPRASAITLDVTDGARVAAALAQAGVCDIVVNNAGIAMTKRLLDTSDEDWDSVLAVNLRGAFLVAREAARLLIAAGQPGSIVNIASILGIRVIPALSAYAASKAALLHLTRSLAIELARYRIRVNAIAPGYIATDINAGFFDTDAGRAMISRIPQRRLGRPEDLSGPLLLLASGASAHMTGSVITVDGGHSINSL